MCFWTTYFEVLFVVCRIPNNTPLSLPSPLLFYRDCYTDVTVKGAVPRAGQTFHQGLISAFILFLNYFPARLSPLHLWAGIFFCKCFYCWLFGTFLASVVCFQWQVWFLLWGCLGWQQEQARGAGDARGSVPSCRAFAAGCARCARLLLSMDFSLPSAQCCSKGVRTRSEPCVLPWCPSGDVVVTAEGWRAPRDRRGRERAAREAQRRLGC